MGEDTKVEEQKGLKYTLGKVSGAISNVLTNNPISVLWNND